jgi:hypothetical protein
LQFHIQLTKENKFCTLQFLALLFALSDPIPNSAEDGFPGLAILSLEDTSIIGNGGVTLSEEAAIIGQGRWQDRSGSPVSEPSEDAAVEAQTHASREMRPGDGAGQGGRRRCAELQRLHGQRGNGIARFSISRYLGFGLLRCISCCWASPCSC